MWLNPAGADDGREGCRAGRASRRCCSPPSGLAGRGLGDAAVRGADPPAGLGTGCARTSRSGAADLVVSPGRRVHRGRPDGGSAWRADGFPFAIANASDRFVLAEPGSGPVGYAPILVSMTTISHQRRCCRFLFVVVCLNFSNT
ncbi:hypothetical protein HBB16_21595 [Pseudonocardia sp. MCCB 268]|nr:hypothetical protein [Pseudonocardia cytotoxica]